MAVLFIIETIFWPLQLMFDYCHFQRRRWYSFSLVVKRYRGVSWKWQLILAER